MTTTRSEATEVPLSGEAVPGHPPAGKRLRRGLVNLAVAGISLMLALMIAEVGIRLVAPQQLIVIRPGMWLPRDTVGYIFHPNLRTIINTGERTVGFWTDPQGFRIGRNGRSEEQAQVLLMGDSFMAALQVEHEQSFAGIAETRLPERIGYPIAIRNGAVSGWGPSEYYFRTKQLLREDRFEAVVVLFFVGNDAVDRLPEPKPAIDPLVMTHFRLPRNLRPREWVDALIRPFNDVMEGHSHLYVFLKNRFKTTLMRLGLSPEYFPVEFLRSEANSPRWAITGEIARQIADVGAARGTPTLFVLGPAKFQVDAGVFGQHLSAFRVDSADVDLDQPSRRLLASFRTQGVMVLDVLPDFRAAHASGQHLFGTVDRHLSRQGHQLLWDLVQPALVSLLTDAPPAGHASR